MRKLCLLLAALIVLSGFAKVNNLIGFGSQKAAAPATLSFESSNSSTSATSSYTFTNQSYGGPGDIIVAVTYKQDSAIDATGLTIDGNGATEIVDINPSVGTRTGVVIYILTVGSGTSADMVFTVSANADRCAIHVYRAQGLGSTAAHDTGTASSSGSNSTAMTVNVPSNGILVAAGLNNDPDADPLTWSGATEDEEFLVNSRPHTSASASSLGVETARSVTINWNDSGKHSGAVATW